MNLAERIIAAREHLGVTQAELAKRVQLSQQAIQKLESGKSESSRRLTEIAVACGVRPEWLSNESGSMLATQVQVKDEGAPYQAAPQSRSQTLTLDADKLRIATEYLETQFSKRRREFVPSQQISLITEVYAFLLRTPTANTVALNRKFAQLIGDGNERERTAGGTEQADRGSHRAGTGTAKASPGRKR